MRRRRRFALGDEFSAKLEQSFTLPTPGLPFLTYTEQPGSDITRTKIRVGHNVRWGGTLELSVGEGPLADKMKALGLDDAPPLAIFRTDEVRAHLPAGKALPYLYSTSDIPPPPPVGSTTTTQPVLETPRASYLPELNPELIQLAATLILSVSGVFVMCTRP